MNDRARTPEELELAWKSSVARSLMRIADALERAHPPAPLVVDLDDPQRGDPTVKLEPREWKGPSFKGYRFSTTHPDFLEALAKMLEYFAGKATDPKKKKYDLLDAARARGWAERLRKGPAAASYGPPGATTSTPASSPATETPAKGENSGEYPDDWDDI